MFASFMIFVILFRIHSRHCGFPRSISCPSSHVPVAAVPRNHEGSKSFILFRNWSLLTLTTSGSNHRSSLPPVFASSSDMDAKRSGNLFRQSSMCRLTAIQQYCPQRPCTILHPSSSSQEVLHGLRKP